MTMTDDVKREITLSSPSKTSVRIAEVSTILRFSGGLHTISGRIALESELHTPAIVQRVRRDLSEIYGVNSEVREQHATNARATMPGYLVRVLDGETLARQVGLLDAKRRQIRGLPNRLTTGSLDDLAGIWRGAFLARGSLTEPGRSGSIEVVCPSNEAAMALVGAASRLGVSAKNREIRNVHKVIIREDDSIAKLLTILGAPETLTAWEALRQQREVRATANRLVNFDDANLRRSAQAAVAACARVERALEILGEDIPDHLLYAGTLRLQHREASLDELGALAVPPITKDAVAGRIRRLLAMADKEASRLGIPDTEANIPSDFE